MTDKDPSPHLIPPHGGYRKLRSYQTAELVYDSTVAFCDRFIDRRSRTHDQMVQAARSGVQNIAEGSMASATSKKTELKLTGVARASLEELLLDYQAFLRQRDLRLWAKDSPEALAVRKKLSSDVSDLSDMSDPEIAANTLICLINQASYLLGKQLQKLEQQFLTEGGFTERLYKTRSQMRDKADSNKFESRGNVRIDYSVPLRSLRLGLIGKADVVEFHKQGDQWIPFPVEYKRGKPKIADCDRVQLCAQAICLEEMLNVEIQEGALFYGQTRRREDVIFDITLREETEDTARKVHELITSGITPNAEYSKKCERCSLLEVCMPKTCGKARSISRYLRNAIEEV